MAAVSGSPAGHAGCGARSIMRYTRSRIGTSTAIVLLPAFAAVCGAPAGCQQRDKPKVIFLEGVVEKVDPVRKFAVVRFRSEKRGSEQTEAVLITRETEILIDGALASLADIGGSQRGRS